MEIHNPVCKNPDLKVGVFSLGGHRHLFWNHYRLPYRYPHYRAAGTFVNPMFPIAFGRYQYRITARTDHISSLCQWARAESPNVSTCGAAALT